MVATTTTTTAATDRRSPTRYRYVARDADGKKVRGVVEAMSLRGARASVMERGLVPVRVREKIGLDFELRAKRVKQVDLMHFSRQLAAFVRAGVPILEAIDGLADSMDNKTFKKALYDVNDALRSGEDFTSALTEHPRVFPAYYHTAVRAAERTGRLDVTLDRLADYLERDIETRRKITSAFWYPGLIIVFAIVVVIVLTTMVMPRFQGLFASLGAELPLPTRMLIHTMDFLASWWWALVGTVVLIALIVTVGGRKGKGREWRDALALKVPGVGALIHTIIIERFCRALGSMTEAAVPLPEALEIAGAGTNNVVFQAGIAQARDRMIGGAGLAEPLAESGLFPSIAIQMVLAGERTGTLERQLINTADFYDKELEYRLKRFTTFFEPAVIIFAGFIVGFVAIALVSAMYGMLTEVDI